MDSSIKPIWRSMKCCRPAFTVKCHIVDNLTLLKTIDLAHADDILVVDFGNNSEAAPWEGKSLRLENCKIDGLKFFEKQKI